MSVGAVRTALTGLGALLVLAGCGRERPPARPEARLGPHPRSQFYIERDLFLAADEPRCVPAEEADFLRDQDEVFGVVVGDGVRERARAYAVTMLSYHHVVNDVIEGIPVAVTY